MKIFILSMLGILLVSCMHDSSKSISEIIAADSSMCALAQKEGFYKALWLYADENVVKLVDGEFPIIGKKEFTATIKGTPVIKTLTWKPVRAEVAKSGELGYTWGNWKLVAPDSTYYGNYFTIWKKQENGEWKFALDGGNNTPPPGK
jgi:ketosteroid isomerase-like protein